jgi:hypothetical protein
MAKHHMTDVFAICVGSLESFTHHLGAQFCGGNVFEAATKGSNGSANTADYDDFTAHLNLLCIEID